MTISNIEPFTGQHCETTATGSLLLQCGIRFSEPMLFGLGQGLSFIFWHMKGMALPFLGGRIKPDVLTSNIARNLQLSLEVFQTSSVSKARKLLYDKVEQGKVVGLKLDSYYLEYFTHKFHFAAHYVAMYGFDNTFVYLIDTEQQGGIVKTSHKSLELARNEKSPMASRNLMYTIQQGSCQYDLADAIRFALKSNALEYLNPPISNLSYLGIRKTATEIKKWFLNSQHVEDDFQTMALLMEKAGTGGALFRNLYRDFLKESRAFLSDSALINAYELFSEVASLWTRVSSLFEIAGKTGNFKTIEEASAILIDISDKERKAMEQLVQVQ